MSRAVSRFRPSGEQILAIAVLLVNLHEVRSMSSRAKHYRGLGLAAKERAAQITDLSLKQTFKDVARHYLALAERVDWLDRQHNDEHP